MKLPAPNRKCRRRETNCLSRSVAASICYCTIKLKATHANSISVTSVLFSYTDSLTCNPASVSFKLKKHVMFHGQTRWIAGLFEPCMLTWVAKYCINSEIYGVQNIQLNLARNYNLFYWPSNLCGTQTTDNNVAKTVLRRLALIRGFRHMTAIVKSGVSSCVYFAKYSRLLFWLRYRFSDVLT